MGQVRLKEKLACHFCAQYYIVENTDYVPFSNTLLYYAELWKHLSLLTNSVLFIVVFT